MTAATTGPAPVRNRGTCTACGRDRSLRVDGTVANHTPGGTRWGAHCAGSHKLPVETAPAAVEPTPDRPESAIHDWIAVTPCGRVESVAAARFYPTAADAFSAWYETGPERRGAINRGVRVVGITRGWWEGRYRAAFGKQCGRRGCCAEPPEDVAPPPMPDLSGATVIHVHPGDRLIFVIRHMPTDPATLAELVEVGQQHLDGVEVLFVTDVTDVIVQSASEVSDAV
jgi:hypothetical protein